MTTDTCDSRMFALHSPHCTGNYLQHAYSFGNSNTWLMCSTILLTVLDSCAAQFSSLYWKLSPTCILIWKQQYLTHVQHNSPHCTGNYLQHAYSFGNSNTWLMCSTILLTVLETISNMHTHLETAILDSCAAQFSHVEGKDSPAKTASTFS